MKARVFAATAAGILLSLFSLRLSADVLSGTVIDSATGNGLDSVRVGCGLDYATYTASNGAFSLNTGTVALHRAPGNPAPVRFGNSGKIGYTVSDLQGRVVVQRSLDRPDFGRLPPGIYIFRAEAPGGAQAACKVCNLAGTGPNARGIDRRIGHAATAAAVPADTLTFAAAGYLPAQRIAAGSQGGMLVKLQRAPVVPGMRFIPGGTFRMGSDNAALEQWTSKAEVPVHRVTVSSFYLDTTDVTQASFTALLGVNPSYFDTGAAAPRRPVEYLTWWDAVLYCNARSKADGRDTIYSYSAVFGTPGDGCDSLKDLGIDFSRNGYRLPTEAEWEYACRAGSSADYYWDQSYPLQTNADSLRMSAHAWWSYNSGTGTQPVATRPPNAFGLYDMAGNVWQWCGDWYTNYTSADQTDPTGQYPEDCRVLRGGSWGYLGTVYLCAAFRYDKITRLRSFNVGFRCARRHD